MFLRSLYPPTLTSCTLFHNSFVMFFKYTSSYTVAECHITSYFLSFSEYAYLLTSACFNITRVPCDSISSIRSNCHPLVGTPDLDINVIEAAPRFARRVANVSAKPPRPPVIR